MKFTALASSSRGNAYLLEAEGVQPLLLEAGIPIKRLREKLNFGLSGLAGCLISHEHEDHSKAVKDLLKAGIDCYMSAGTARALAVTHHHRIVLLPDRVCWTLPGGWHVLAFPLEHDASEPIGFFISHSDDHLLFIPDTAFVKNKFKEPTIICVECNNIEEILSRNIQNGTIPVVVGRRVRRNHMSLSTLVAMLTANDLSQCRQIWLLHLSDSNSDEKRMVRAVQEATGIPCYVSEA